MGGTNRGEQRDRKLGRIIVLAITHAEPHTAQRNAGILGVGRGDRGERRRLDLDSDERRRIEPPYDGIGIEPRSPQDPERRPSPTTHRHIRPLEQTGTRIEQRALEVGHIGRRFDPR